MQCFMTQKVFRFYVQKSGRFYKIILKKWKVLMLSNIKLKHERFLLEILPQEVLGYIFKINAMFKQPSIISTKDV